MIEEVQVWRVVREGGVGTESVKKNRDCRSGLNADRRQVQSGGC